MPTHVPTSSTSNTWTLVGGATAHECVDETVALQDGDTSYLSTTGTATVRFKFTGLVEPGIYDGTKIRLWAKTVGATQYGVLTVTLDVPGGAGPDFILRQDTFPLSAAYQLYEFEVDPGFFLFSTNWRLTVSGAAAAAEELRISAVELFVPAVVQTRLTRGGLEVQAKSPATPQLRATRVALEVQGKTGTVPEVRVTRAGIEVQAPALAAVRVTRAGLEVQGKTPPPEVRVTRAGLEVQGKNPLLVSGIVPSALPGVLPNILSANWSDEVSLQSTWQTDVVEAESVAEERRSHADRPWRTLTVKQTGLARDEALRLWMNLKRMCQGRQVVPLFCDHSRVTQASSGTTLYCVTAYRRFFIGARVLVHTWSSGRPASPAYVLVAGIQADRLILQAGTPLPQTYPAGARVYPVMETEVDLEQSGVFVTDEVFDVQLVARESPGKWALPTTTDDWPAWMPQWGGVAVLDVRVDWSDSVQVRVVRAGERSESGRSTIVLVRGDRPQVVYEVDVTALSRAEAWKIVEFHDAARGRTRSFYLVSPDTSWTATAVGQTSTTVRAAGNYEDARDFVDFLAVRRTDSSVVVVPVTGTTDNLDGTWTFTYADPGTTLSLVTTRKLSTAHRARQESDTLEELWQTDEVCRLHLSAREVLRDQDVELASVTDSIPNISGPSSIADLVYWIDANVGVKWNRASTSGDVFTPHRDEVAVIGDRVHIVEDARASLDDPASYPHTFIIPWTLPFWLAVDDAGMNGGMRTIAPGVNGSGIEVSVLGPGSTPTAAKPVEFIDTSLGFTYVFCGRLRSDTYHGLEDYAVQLLRQTGVVEFIVGSFSDGPTQNVVKFYETIDVENVNHRILMPELQDGSHVVLMLVWKPGVGGYARVYRNGSVVGSSSVVPTTLPTNTSRRVSVCRLSSVDPPNLSQWFPGDLTADSMILLGRTCCLNAIMTYKRALSTSELNQLGTYLRGRYGAPFLPIP